MRASSPFLAVTTVSAFWRLMNANDFFAVSTVLADDFTLEWPQSKERIRGPERFARMNSEFPAKGRWKFTVNRIVGADDEAVSDVSVTDGFRHDRAVSFFTLRDGRISRIVEYWPEPFAPASNRAHLVESMS
jgi:ketosteroid isomerase-like protein